MRCSERRHQLNRRTELKIIGYLNTDPYEKLSLKEIIKEELFQKMLEEVQNQKIIEIKEGEELPSEIKEAKQKQSKTTRLQKARSEGSFEIDLRKNIPKEENRKKLPFIESKVPKSKTNVV